MHEQSTEYKRVLLANLYRPGQRPVNKSKTKQYFRQPNADHRFAFETQNTSFCQNEFTAGPISNKPNTEHLQTASLKTMVHDRSVVTSDISCNRRQTWHVSVQMKE